MVYTKLQVKWGILVAGVEEDGALVGLWFENQKHFPEIPSDAIWIDDNKKSVEVGEVMETIHALNLQLKSYEQGELKRFDLKLSPKGTKFQKIVWNILEKIPYGDTTTYGEVSKLVAKEMKRNTMAAQAVGSAIGYNPISIVIPCHRVLGSNGSLTGYAGGLDKKSALLAHEGVVFEEQLSFNI